MVIGVAVLVQIPPRERGNFDPIIKYKESLQ